MRCMYIYIFFFFKLDFASKTSPYAAETGRLNETFESYGRAGTVGTPFKGAPTILLSLEYQCHYCYYYSHDVLIRVISRGRSRRVVCDSASLLVRAGDTNRARCEHFNQFDIDTQLFVGRNEFTTDHSCPRAVQSTSVITITADLTSIVVITILSLSRNAFSRFSFHTAVGSPVEFVFVNFFFSFCPRCESHVNDGIKMKFEKNISVF